MNFSKISLWLSVLIACLVLFASGSGILFTSTYAGETAPWVIQAIGQDIANLVTVLTLLIAVFFARKGSVRAYLVWIGVLLTLLYAYAIYAFAAHFNHLFLVYVSILGLCFYTLVYTLIRLPLDHLRPAFASITRVRLVSAFLLVLGILFYMLWLSEDIPAIVSGRIPQSVIENGLLTNPVHVLDMGIYLPAMIITGILLWQRKLLGYLMALPMLMFSILTGIGILAIDLVSGIKGMAISFGVDTFIATIVLVSIALSILFVREMQKQSDVVLV